MATNHTPSMPDAFVDEAFKAMKERQALKGQLQIETARQVFYNHGLIASSDDLRELMLLVRRKYASQYEDTGI